MPLNLLLTRWIGPSNVHMRLDLEYFAIWGSASKEKWNELGWSVLYSSHLACKVNNTFRHPNLYTYTVHTIDSTRYV